MRYAALLMVDERQAAVQVLGGLFGGEILFGGCVALLQLVQLFGHKARKGAAEGGCRG